MLEVAFLAAAFALAKQLFELMVTGMLSSLVKAQPVNVDNSKAKFMLTVHASKEYSPGDPVAHFAGDLIIKTETFSNFFVSNKSQHNLQAKFVMCFDGKLASI